MHQLRCMHCGLFSDQLPRDGSQKHSGKKFTASNIKIYRSEENRPVNILVQCQQCENAPCVSTCPFGANYYDENGLVRNDPSKCVGCNYCIASCPYDCRWSHPDTGLPVKCISEGCLKLIKDGQQPACVQACPAEARLSATRWIRTALFLKKLLLAVQKCLCLIKVRSLTFT